MGNLNRRFTQLGAVLVLSSVALVGCSSSTINDPAPTSKSSSSSEAKGTKKADPNANATAESAATFANGFFASLLQDNGTDFSKLNPPVELTEAQAEQLFLDGKVDGVSDEKLEELVQYLYENHPLGKDIYFAKDASVQERLQVISALMLAQQYASTLKEDQTPKKIDATDVSVDKSGEAPVASIANSNQELSPVLIFVNGSWKVDGSKFLQSIGVGGASATPEPTPSAG